MMLLAVYWNIHVKRGKAGSRQTQAFFLALYYSFILLFLFDFIVFSFNWRFPEKENQFLYMI